MGWSNTGAIAIFTTQVNLVDAEGNVDGTLDGLNGLVLYGGGDANNPGFFITPAGDVGWFVPGFDQTDDTTIEIGASFNANGEDVVGFRFSSGSLNNQAEGVMELMSAPASGDSLPFGLIWPYWVPPDPTIASGPPNVIPEKWKGLITANGWADAGGGFSPIGYRLMPDGTVLLRGVLSGGTATDGTVVATVGSHYVPGFTNNFPISANESFPRIAITTAGNIECFGLTAGNSIVLDGIRYPAATLTP